MPKLENISIPSDASRVLVIKFIKLDSLLTNYRQLLDLETSLDNSLVLSEKEKRNKLSDLYHDFKCLDKKVGKIWDTLSGSQQVTAYDGTKKDLQFVYDGY